MIVLVVLLPQPPKPVLKLRVKLESFFFNSVTLLAVVAAAMTILLPSCVLTGQSKDRGTIGTIETLDETANKMQLLAEIGDACFGSAQFAHDLFSCLEVSNSDLDPVRCLQIYLKS